MHHSYRLFFLAGWILMSNFLHASILTVSNDPAMPAQYDAIDLAITAANSGDTLYIHGSPDPYFSSAYQIDKPLVLIGPGKNPQKERPLLAFISGQGGSGGTINLLAGSDGTQLIGLYIRSSIRNIGNVNNILIQGCVVGGAISSSGTISGANWVIRDNVIRLEQGVVNPYAIIMNTMATNFLFENNVIGGIIREGGGAIFRHNIFIQNQSGFGDTFSGVCSNNLMEDNVWYGVSPGGCSSCTFNHNITFGAGNNNLPAGSSGTGNLIGQDPDFVDASLTVVNYAWRTYDFRLITGSPGIGAGSSGDDIGLYGNPSGTFGGSGNIPLIKSMSVDNSVVPAGGQLQLNLISTKPEGN